MRDAFDAFVRDEEEFTAPNRSISTVTRAVPRNAECGRRNFIFRHARQNVGDVVLDLHDNRSAGLRHGVLWFVAWSSAFRRPGPAKAGTPNLLQSKLGRKIIRVQIGGDDLRFGLV